MTLTEEMKRWNQRLEERMKKTQDIGYLDKFSKEIQEIYSELRRTILSLYPETQITTKKNYLSFKAKTTFLDVQPQSKLLKCVINIKAGKLKGSRKILRDISKIGHFGRGDYDFSIISLEDIKKSLDLIKHSYNINS